MPVVFCNRGTPDRAIAFEAVENARELGGLVMQDGRSIRPYLLIRSGNLSRATDNDVSLLLGKYNLTDVYDFRFEAEEAGAPDRLIDGVKYYHLSTLPRQFIEGFSSGRSDTVQIKSEDMVGALIQYAFDPRAQKMARDLYPAIISDSLSQKYYGDFLRGLLTASGGVLWHCSQGKDRAGWASAFVLAALGASMETIVEDFDLSNSYYAPFVEKLTSRIEEMGGGDNEKGFIRSMIGVSRENFERTLYLIDDRYGSIYNYVETVLGFGRQEQCELRSKFLF